MVATNAQSAKGITYYVFQSAFHRGNGCYNLPQPHLVIDLHLSVRFSSRQWLLLIVPNLDRRPDRSFSPLFIAAMVATNAETNTPAARKSFSPLFIAAMVATNDFIETLVTIKALSVRFSSRQWLLLDVPYVDTLVLDAFSPLFIAAMVATNAETNTPAARKSFSPLFIAAMVATNDFIETLVTIKALSVRFSSRQWLLLDVPYVDTLVLDAFSPLFIAAMVATTSRNDDLPVTSLSFSPLFIAAMVATKTGS